VVLIPAGLVGFVFYPKFQIGTGCHRAPYSVVFARAKAAGCIMLTTHVQYIRCLYLLSLALSSG